MATISFSTKPQKKYYTYKEDGCIIEISSSKPTTKPSNGGIWYCYFECIPYHYDTDGKYYQLYEDEDCTIEVTKSSYNKGETYYHKGSDKTHAQSVKYYSANELYSYAMPNIASELPQVTYNETEGNDSTEVTRYFDTLIVDGDVYKDNKFTAMEIADLNGTSQTKSTYGDRLKKMVDNSVTLDCFTKDVNAIPDYLKQPIKSIEYYTDGMPYNYFLVYGELFLNLLTNVMVDLAETYKDKYLSDAQKEDYYRDGLEIQHSVKSDILRPTSTITIITMIPLN